MKEKKHCPRTRSLDSHFFVEKWKNNFNRAMGRYNKKTGIQDFGYKIITLASLVKILKQTCHSMQKNLLIIFVFKKLFLSQKRQIPRNLIFSATSV